MWMNLKIMDCSVWKCPAPHSSSQLAAVSSYTLVATMQFSFLELIEGLKNIERKRWALRGVPHSGSISDHMYRMAIMCLMVPGVRRTHLTN
jgi:hypothetical protein